MSETAHLSLITSKDELFKYTSGRWIHNKHLRLAECYLQFNIPALMNIITAASGHMTSDIVSFFKLAEGGFNCLFQATFRDGKHVITRLPYPSTAPERYAVASKAATLDYLRLHGFPTPEVANLVSAEYIIMEKLDGTPLGDMCIYYQRDLPTERKVPLSGHHRSEFCMGPMAHYGWWHRERSVLDIDRGPFGEQEMTWVKAYAKPRLPYKRLYREVYGFCQVLPDCHIENLSKYLTLAPCLRFRTGSSLDQPPNNILISDANEVVGLVDWQHSTILPLGLTAGIPKYFQNYGDPDSEKLIEPRINLPSNFKSLPESDYAGSPWEGDLITLKADMIRAVQSWTTLISADSIGYKQGTCSTPIIAYPGRVVCDILALDARQREADVAMDQMRDVLGINILSWVPNDEYEAVKEKAREIKAKMLEAAETNEDRIRIQDHFPFNNFDENS
ncbi:uncharacterized protein P174DRAFT_509561 [Aspergillus novofumigatus IBT 16806]|uniref:Aminoglycoside phosphotransferase domain-containing protein n=1 Tax=Aspergillus novofumigatus (strain IBT 16806) TaxID=1392255 RepID=A0A2I1CF78_ASPN1|nr:uncharacterized protein P174DRAFT_509561 [Aspergillus novofumigatus IBT 16806]PKX96286.1 hypothetical protein P174DRAFT_509561 [Aspergillus novofumigatus IBT 16806]